MKSLNRMLVGACLIIILNTNTEVLAQDKPEFSLTADYFVKYIWRGQNLNDDPVFQPGFSATYWGFTAGIWGNLDTTDIHRDEFSGQDNNGEFTEVDYYADYSGSIPGLDILGFSVGAIYYDFPNTRYEGTTEVYGGLSLDVLLSPSVTFYRDVDEVKGLYVSASIEHEFEKIFELGPDIPVALDLGASFGWANSAYNCVYWGVDKNKANDLAFSVSLPFEIAGISITPSFHYMMLVDSDIKDSSGYDDEFFVGIGLSKGF